MNSMKKEVLDLGRTLKETKTLILLIILAVITAASFVLMLGGSDKRRYVLKFEHMNKEGLYVESRYLPKVDSENSLRLFIDDVLLGPLGDRYKLLFPRGTRVESYYIRDRTLFLGLSEEALHINGNDSSQNKEGAEIFRKNVFRNFRNIDIINLYIDGRKMYDE